MLHLTPDELKIIKDILQAYPYTFYVFGSRLKGTAKKFSDLDLCYKDLISDETIGNLREQFEESDLPFKVDFLSWQRCLPEFQILIAPELVDIKTFIKTN